MSVQANDVTVAIPTFGRDEVLVATIRAVLEQRPAVRQVLVIDQSVHHEPATESALTRWHESGGINWVRLSKPSIPVAMNTALYLAATPIVLFVDDDVRLLPRWAESHAEAYSDDGIWAVVGQVLQPGEEPRTGAGAGCHRAGLLSDLDFCFRATEAGEVHNVMAGNLSVRRERALSVGGFDESFVGVAYRFETEFARRLEAGGGRIRYEPRAVIHHLRAARGGTRQYGLHLTSASPAHGVGDYYYALRCGCGWERISYLLKRPWREVMTRFHLAHPWYIPVKLMGEWRALWLAIRLAWNGPLLAGRGKERARQ